MKTTARFDIERKTELKKVFKQADLVKTWRNVVKDQMRRMDIKDLHDYYDFNYHIEEQADLICSEIIDGSYIPALPIIYKKEKQMGICRHMMLPSPHDALVFQRISELIGDKLSKKSHPNAYYSREKSALKLPHEFGNESFIPWYVLWAKFQKELFKTSEKNSYLAITDVTNYYDNIYLPELRKVVASQINSNEVVLDFLFNILNRLTWAPDYLPNSNRGLPTMDIEAPRILAHTFLFEIDRILAKRTKDSFVRWMDDINFGAKSLDEAYTVLGELNDVLKSRGLALNLKKTTVIESTEVKAHFKVDENLFLDELTEKFNKNTLTSNDKTKFRRKFKKLMQNGILNQKSGDKVIGRFYTLGLKLKSRFLLPFTAQLFNDYPYLRANILRYLVAMGFRNETKKIYLQIFTETKVHDDTTLFMIVHSLTELSIPYDGEGKQFINTLIAHLDKLPKEENFYSIIWFASKYYSRVKLWNFIIKNKEFWSRDGFLSRQVLSCIHRCLIHKKDEVIQLIQEQLVHGKKESTSCALNIINLLTKKDYGIKKLNPYLFPQNSPKIYPLPKFHILCARLISGHLTVDEKNKIKSYVKDGWMNQYLADIKEAKFEGGILLNM